MKKFFKFVDKTDKWITALCVVDLVVLTAFVIMAVLFRYGFSKSFQWMEELCRYMFIGFIFLMCGPVIWREKHINVDLLLKMATGKTRKNMEIIGNILLLAAFGYIFYYSVIWVATSYKLQQLTASQAFLLWQPTIIVPIGLGLSILYTVATILKKIYYYNSTEGDKDYDEINAVV